jgi:hypothetical protein
MLALLNDRGPLSTRRPDLSRPLGLADHIFDENDLHALHHWQTVTVQTMGTTSSAAMYERELLRLSFIVLLTFHCPFPTQSISSTDELQKHPYLMHAILTISTLHQRLLLDPGNSIPNYAEYYHWSRTVLLFNANLDTSIREQDRDAMFATGTIMSGISWAWTNTTDPEQSWPNNESDSDESGIETGHPGKDHLEWLNVPRGLRLLIPIARPFRKGSLFAGSWREQEMHVDPLDHSPVPSIAVVGAGQTDPLDPTARPGTGPREYAALPSQLADLCHVILNCSSPSYFSPASSFSTSIPTSTPQLSSLSSWTPPPAPCPALTIPTPPPNPYSTALRLLSPLFKIDCTRANIIRHIAFITAVPADFISLLQSRDPRALLILACWYGLILRTSDSWWLVRRARVECGAICVYLDRWADGRGVGVDGGQVDVERRERDKVRELMAFPAEMCGYRTWGGKRREGIGDWEGNRRINEQDEERKAWGWLLGMVGWW